MLASHPEGLAVGFEQRFLALVLLAEEAFDDLGFDVQQRRQRAEIDDVLEQLPLARIGVRGIAHRRERHAELDHVLAKLRRRQRLGRIVEEPPARIDLGDVLVPGLRIHRHHEIDPTASSPPTILDHANFVPRRQALDIRREDVARRHRHAHAQDGFGEQPVGRRGAGPVDVGKLDDEIVDADRSGHRECRRQDINRRPVQAHARRVEPPRAASRTGRPPVRPRKGTSACPTPRSGTVPRTGRNAGTRPRPSP